MSMRPFGPIAVTLAILLAGCLGTTADLSGSKDETGSALHEGVQVYGGPDGVAAAPASFGTPDWRDLGHYGPEPTLGITSSGAIFVAAFSSILRSVDGGETFEVVQEHLLSNSDPMMWVDTLTDRVYNAPMFPILACSSLYWSDDDGDTWTGAPSFACGRTVFDHQKLASGAPGPDANPLAGVLHPTVLYMCYNGVATTNCGVSYDGGQGWSWDRITDANLMTNGCLSGQNGHPTAAPDGTVVFARTWGCERAAVYVSADSGLSWTKRLAPEYPVPGGAMEGNLHGIDPEVAFTTDGTMYLNVHAPDQHQYIVRSDDMGETWSEMWDVTPPGVNGTVFQAMAAGSPGRVALAFIGSDWDGESAQAPDDTRWHVYIVTSEDADSKHPTWTSYKVTPDDDPVQIGCVVQGGGTDPCRNMLDFIDAVAAPDGTFHVAFTDGCVGDCADDPDATPDMSRAGEAAVAALRGWSLYTDGDGRPALLG